jgi:hypothetical protein
VVAKQNQVRRRISYVQQSLCFHPSTMVTL